MASSTTPPFRARWRNSMRWASSRTGGSSSRRLRQAAWAKIEQVIVKNDPWCRGVVLLGLEAPQDELVAAFAATANATIVKGFAVGRTIFINAAEQWLAGRMSDDEAVADMAARFEQLTEAWLAARGRKAA
ncbi:2-deoxy-5-keto-D-gluconate 6-phosphate aldolase domain-containing protein [Mesorhizobium atlanticum]